MPYMAFVKDFNEKKQVRVRTGVAQRFQTTLFLFSCLLSLALNEKVWFGYCLNFAWSTLVYYSLDWFGFSMVWLSWFDLV